MIAGKKDTPRQIYLTGASCSGVTSLGHNLSLALDLLHVDVDDVFWMPTDPPFTTKRPVQERLGMLKEALSGGAWVLSGSLNGWGDRVVAQADLIVLLVTSTPVRMARLRDREAARFGSRILPGQDMYEIHASFSDWASRYDDPDFEGRNLRGHLSWLASQSVPTLQLDGAEPEGRLLQQVIAALGH